MNNEIETLFKFLNESLELFNSDYVKLLNCCNCSDLAVTELEQILFYTKIQYTLFTVYKEYDSLDYNLDKMEEFILYLVQAIKEKNDDN